ncbi:MAG: hypothetical protein JWP65_1851 [Ramlibacter sp.]|jgi:hypothetical protein|uniref:hypothetical protein n=1 Tax=Ramlibacter sp. TaxID=1917967 RepID=UPI00261CE150|nr:hypothetical protein [Ramlibacter sp.]MDB5751430.1 hypothetical protein [Ramlibacter sp.]
MNRIRAALLVTVSLWTAAHAQDLVRAARQGDVHVYATQQKTDRRVFDETITVTAVEGDRLRTRHERSDGSAATEGMYGKDWSTLKSGVSGATFDPPGRMLAPPLEAGKSWLAVYRVKSATGGESQVKMESRVAAREKLATPAGEYDTWRIESRGYVNGVSWTGGFGVLQKVWYAPAIDRIVRSEYREQRRPGTDNVAELKQFKPAD